MENEKIQNVIVTGGAGFLGINLINKLISSFQNIKIFVIDNYCSCSLDNILKVINENSQVNFTKGDISNNADINALLKCIGSSKIDKIYNLASPASPPRYQEDPIKTLKTNFLGTCNMLDVAFEHGSRFLQASTSEVYGDPEQHPQNELYCGKVNTIGPRACYDEGKRAAETLAAEFHNKKKLDTRIARIFNTYGPFMDPNDGRVVSNFIMSSIKGQDLTIYGDGLQTRSFCYVSDLVDGLIKLMEREYDKDIYRPVNLGNPQEFQILELAKKINLIFNKDENKFKFFPIQEDDPKQRRPDITRAIKKLNWSPHVDLDHGLKETINYFKLL